MPFIQFQFRRGNASQWTSANPILADGELAIESDTSKFKIGNGIGSWTLLPYGGLVGPTGAIGNVVSIDISFNGNIFVGRDVSFGGKLAVRNDVSFNTELRVGGNVNVRSSAIASSSGTGALIVAGGVGVGGNLWTGGNLIVGLGDVSFNNRLNVGGDVNFNGGNLNISKTTVSTSIGTGALIVSGGVGVGGSLWTGGNLNVALDASFNNRLFVGKDVSFGAKLFVESDASFNGNTSFAFLPVYNGSVTPATNQLITRSYVDTNGGAILLSSNNTWTANNTFNGSRFYVNADASFQNKLTVGDDVSLNARLLVGGNVVFGRNLVVIGDASFNDNLNVRSDSSFNANLYVGTRIGVGVTANSAYSLDVLGNINLSGSLFLNNKLFSITSADISLNANLSVGVDASFNGNVFIAKTLNYRKTVITGAAVGSPTSIVAATPIVEITGAGASTAYFNLANGSYAGQTLTINSATNGGGGGLFVNATSSNIIFNGSLCSQMRFSNAFQTVNLLWSADVNDWIVASWQGVNFSGISMNFGTYTSGDITLTAAGRVNVSSGVGGMVVGADSSFNGNLSVGGTDSSFNSNLYVGVGKRVGIGRLAGATYALDVGGNINLTGNLFTNGILFSAFDNSKDISLNANLSVASDSSFNANLFIGRRLTVSSGDVSLNQRLTVGGADSSFNGNLYVGGSINSEAYIERFVNVASSSGAYTADFNNGLVIYINAFSGSSTPTLSITNLPTVLNQSYVFTVVYSGAATSTYFSALNVNGVSVPVNGSVSLSAASSYYVHQFAIFFTDATNLSNNFVVQSFNSSAPLSLVSPSVSGNLSVNGNINLIGGNIFQNGVLFVGGSGGSGGSVGTTGNSLSLSGNLFVGGNLFGNGDVSFNANVSVGGNINFRGNLFQNGVLFTGGGGTTGTSLSLSSTTESVSKTTGAFIVAGGAGIGGNVEVGGNVDIAFNTASTNSTTGSLIVRGGAGITGNIYTGGIVSVGSATESVSKTTGAVIVTGGAGIGGNVQVGGNVRIAFNTASTSSSTGSLVVGGGVGIDGNLNTNNNINTSGVIQTTNSGAAVSSSTGAIIVNGGIGVGGNVQVAGIIRTTLTIVSTTSTTGALIVGGGAGVAGNIYAGGVINTSLTTPSTSSGTGALIVGGGAGVAGNIYVGSSLYVTGSIVSPSLTGIPIAPTATGGGAGSTQVATTAYVRGEINSLINGAPGALDTLLELGNALGSDLAFSTTVTNSIATKAPIANPTFTGVVGGITKSMVGLTNVDDTSDANKPVSTATQNALNLKLNLSEPSIEYYIANSGSGSYLVNGVSNGNIYFEKGKKYKIHINASGHPFWIQTVPGAYSSSNLYNTGITNNGTQSGYIDIELLSSAPQLYYACQFHSSMVGSIITGTTVETYKSLSNISNVDNTSDVNKPVSTATQTALNLKSNLANPTFTGTITTPAASVTDSTASTNTTSGALRVVGGVGIGGAVYTGGIINVGSTAVSTSTTTGALIVGGGAGFAGNIHVGGNVNFAGNLFQNGVLFTGGSSGPNLTLAGNLVVNGTAQSSSRLTGAIIVAGGIGVGGNVEVGGNIEIASSIASTSTTTGALTVAGGVGIGGAVNVGNNLTVRYTSASLQIAATHETQEAALFLATPNTGNFGCKTAIIAKGMTSFSRADLMFCLNQDVTSNDINVTSADARMTIKHNTGFVGIGTTTPATMLQVNGGITCGAITASGAVNITNSTQTSGPSGPAALVVTGGVGIGLGLSVGGAINVGSLSISTFNGGINALSFNATSDYRVKQNVRLIGDDPSFNVDVLRPVTYNNSRAGKQDIGFIAHEVGEHYPFLVNGEKDGHEMQSLNYTGIIGILVKEIQELKRRVAELEYKG